MGREVRSHLLDDTAGAFRSFLRQLCLPYRGYAFVPVSFGFFLFRAIKCARFNLSRTGLGGFLAMAVLIALMPSKHSDLSSANANVPLNSRNVMAMNQSRASGRRGIAPFRVRTCFRGQWCVGVRLLGEFKNAQRILAYRRRLCCLSSVHAQFSRLPLAPCWRSIDANQYEIPFKLNISTFHVSVMASTPAIASHIVRHPSSSNFSVFMAPRQAAVASGVRG